MNIRVQTASGSTYLFKSREMTWQRRNANAGHENIAGNFNNDGKLRAWPDFVIGFPLRIEDAEVGSITTTRINLIMDVGESAIW